jgi:hypothetical protein
MTFTVIFNCDNAAFETDLEAAIAKTLRYVANRVDEHSTLSQPIRDRNGNLIGRFQLIAD